MIEWRFIHAVKPLIQRRRDVSVTGYLGGGYKLSLAIDFYNYFQFGVDFLISSKTHLVQKIVLHTNIVSTLYLISERL